MAKAAGLLSGVFTGAVLAVAILAERPGVWIDLVQGDAGWIVEMEWNAAVAFAWRIAFIGTLFWIVIARRRLASLISAAILGFALTALVAGLLLFGGDHEKSALIRISICALFGLAGAIAGVITFGVDRTTTLLLARGVIAGRRD
jgi:hypothetical protein